MQKLLATIHHLVEGEPLPPTYRDHPLTGPWTNCRDCHIEPDWILIYMIDGNDVHLLRTGTHADLF
jgi:mRNA interferase YafQ